MGRVLTSHPKSDVAAAILGSPEYAAGRGTQQDADFVNGLYQGFFGRPSDPEGLSAWTAALAAGMSRAAVAAKFADGAEAKHHWVAQTSLGLFAYDPAAATVRSAYAAGFGREADTGGLSLHDFGDALAAFPEFAARHSRQDDAAFIDNLFQDGLGRGGLLDIGAGCRRLDPRRRSHHLRDLRGGAAAPALGRVAGVRGRPGGRLRGVARAGPAATDNATT